MGDERRAHEDLRRFPGRLGMVAPIRAGDRLLGTLSIALTERQKDFGPHDVALVEELARRASAAIENARLYSERTYIAETLQEPPAGEPAERRGLRHRRDLPARRGWHRGRRRLLRRSSRPAAEAGGWRSPTSAARASRPPRSPRWPATRCGPPRCTMPRRRRCSRRSMTRCSTTSTATSSVLSRSGWSRPTASQRAWAWRSGHPAPFILRDDRSVESVGAPGSLLGVLRDPTLTEVEITLGCGDTLLLYTRCHRDEDETRALGCRRPRADPRPGAGHPARCRLSPGSRTRSGITPP